jgi:Kef-type K+ transport system membrane component KefB
VSILLQVALILVAARLLRRPAATIGLPPVIAAVLGGLLLGPTVLGAVAPAMFRAVFPPEGLHALGTLGSWIIAGYWLVIALELEPGGAGGGRTALALTALVSAVVPGLLGHGAATLLETRLAPSGLPPGALGLSVALCFSVTAFPVISRIVEDSGLSRQPAGRFATSASAVLELGVWACLPAALTLYASASATRALVDLASAFAFVAVGLTLGGLALRRLWARIPADGPLTILVLGVVGVGSAFLASRLGVHAVIGAFVAGAGVPRHAAAALAKKVKPVAVFLLPIFFATPGLRTSLGSCGAETLVVMGGLVVLAHVAKLLVTTVAARATAGLSWRDAAVVGHLMGARGAIGFAIVELCLDRGLLESRSYSILACLVSASTVLAAWGALLQRRPWRTADVRATLAAQAQRA